LAWRLGAFSFGVFRQSDTPRRRWTAVGGFLEDKGWHGASYTWQGGFASNGWVSVGGIVWFYRSLGIVVICCLYLGHFLRAVGRIPPFMTFL
jgi:hypothetical protein